MSTACLLTITPHQPCCRPVLPRPQVDVNQRDAGPVSGAALHDEKLGNTVLHCLIMHRRTDMFRYLVQQKGANTWAKNRDGDTPLLLAARRNMPAEAQLVIDTLKQTVWNYGPVTCVRYPLYEIEQQPSGGASMLQVDRRTTLHSH